MELTRAIQKKERTRVVRRECGTALPPDLAPPPWALRLLRGAGAAPFRATAAPFHVDVTDGAEFTLATARVAGAAGLDDESFERCAAEVYAALCEVIRARPGRHPVRFWNHIPDIRRTNERGLDRYMLFNAGRYAACSEWFGSPAAFRRLLPTASAVGHDGSDLVVHVLAADAPGTAVENPRQVPSYQYSKRFGPRPPCFARATVMRPRGAGAPVMLVGGTASIRGEESVHLKDLAAQTAETLENLAALVTAAGAHRPDPLRSFRELRVYYVRPADLEPLRRLLSPAFSHLDNVEWLRADLCRAELLVEIEGVAAPAA